MTSRYILRIFFILPFLLGTVYQENIAIERNNKTDDRTYWQVRSSTKFVPPIRKLTNMAEEENAPAPVQIDFQTLNPLSPEVISKQATINIGTHLLACSLMRRHDWTRRARQVHRRQGHLGRADGSIQE